MAGRGTTLEGILGVCGGSSLPRFLYCACSRDRYIHVGWGGRHSIGINMVLCVPCLAGGIGMLLGLGNCFFVEMRIQCRASLPGLWRKNSRCLYHPCRDVPPFSDAHQVVIYRQSRERKSKTIYGTKTPGRIETPQWRDSRTRGTRIAADADCAADIRPCMPPEQLSGE
jgi:hypothetical protein